MGNRLKVLIVEDDRDLMDRLADQLKEHITVYTASNYNNSLEIIRTQNIDVAICDIFIGSNPCLEAISGFKSSNTQLKILIITGNPLVHHLVELINLRVDGILEKPFTAEELLAKIYSITTSSESVVTVDEITLVPSRRCAKVNDQLVLLTKTEFVLLEQLMEQEGIMVPRLSLLERVWPGMNIAKNTLDTHLCNLKKKIPSLEKKLICLHGEGYVLEK